jgi:hypothetical protein
MFLETAEKKILPGFKRRDMIFGHTADFIKLFIQRFG